MTIIKYDKADVLLVEDNPADAELVQRVLSEYNNFMRVLWLRDGQEALDYLSCQGDFACRPCESCPKMVLLDLKMPKVDGIEVLARIKSSGIFADVPVIMLTSSQEERDLLESYELGINSYIVKPVDYDAFVEAVSSIVDHYWWQAEGNQGGAR